MCREGRRSCAGTAKPIAERSGTRIRCRGGRSSDHGDVGGGEVTALAQLARRGHRVVDTDHGGWSEQVPAADGSGMEQLWREDRMQALLAEIAAGPLFVSGCVANQGKFSAESRRSSCSASRRTSSSSEWPPARRTTSARRRPSSPASSATCTRSSRCCERPRRTRSTRECRSARWQIFSNRSP